MVKLTKDSVGKVYVDALGGLVTMVFFDEEQRHIVGITEKGNYIPFHGYGGAITGERSHINSNYRLVSEYTPPRTDKEIMADLVKALNGEGRQVAIKNHDGSYTYITKYVDLLKEAEERLGE